MYAHHIHGAALRLYCLACSAFKQDIIGNDDGSAAMLFEQCLHMLKEIELFVRCRRPEILALINQRFPVSLSLTIYNGDAAFLPRRRIRKHYLEAITGVAGQ